MPNDQKRPAFAVSFDTQMIVDRLRKMDIGDTVSYDDLSTMLGKVANGSLPALQTAIRIMRREHLAAFQCMDGTHVVRLSDEQIVQTGAQTVQKIRRAAKRGLDKLVCAKFDVLSEEAKREFNAKASHLSLLRHVTSPQATAKLASKVQIGDTPARLPVEETLRAFGK
jgi:transposase